MSHMENRFNLIDEPWIPVTGIGRVSLRQVFENPHHRSLGGNPVQKIALMKLLLAIAQAANTPADEQAWQALGAEGLARSCLAYLERWHARFYLHGEQPFLQMPAIERLIQERTKNRLISAKTLGKIAEVKDSGLPKSMGAGFYPDLPSGNNTVLSHTLFEKELTSADKALFIVTLMNFAFGGKRVEADMNSLAGREMGNRYTAAAGPSLGSFIGQLHCFVVSGSIQEDIWINTLTYQNINKIKRWPQGLGTPPWERMPTSELDSIATKHKETYQACLVALSRFVLLDKQGIYYLDGLSYPNFKDGWYEPSLVLNNTGKDINVKYVDPEKRPWRELQSLLSFMEQGESTGFESFNLKNGIERLCDDKDPQKKKDFAIWSAGLKVSSNSGDQSVKRSDDFVESLVWLNTGMLGQPWFSQLKIEMNALDELAKRLYGCVVGFFKEQKSEGGKLAAQSSALFWQLCERDFQQLVDACDQDERGTEQRLKLRLSFASYVYQAYDQFCPKETARQLDAWAKCRPNNSKYLHQEV